MVKKLRVCYSSGFVLIAAMLILVVISLLVMTQLNRVWLYSKTLTALNQQSESLYSLESAMNQLIKRKTMIHPDCQLQGDQPQAALYKSKASPCVLSAAQASMTYVVEDLGGQPCLVIKKSAGKKQAHLWRYTLYEAKSASILQVLVVHSMKAQSCQTISRLVSPGIQSRRYLFDAGLK